MFALVPVPPVRRPLALALLLAIVTATSVPLASVAGAAAASATPPLAVSITPLRADEGSAVTLRARVTGATDAPAVDWDLDDDGTFGETDDEQAETPVVPAGNGPGVLTVAARVRDGGRTATRSEGISVDNVAPSADAGGPYATELGGRITATATATDPYDTVLDFDWDLDEDGSFDDWTLPEVTFQPAAGGTMQARVRVDDRDGGVTTAPALVRVDAPQSPSADLAVTLAGDPAAAAVDDAIAVVASVTNAGPETAPETLVFVDVPPVLADATAEGCDDSGDSLRCELGDLAVGETVRIRVTGTVASADAGQVLATVGGGAVDGELADNEARLLVGETEATERISVSRIGGDDRLATAVAIAQAGFGDDTAEGVVLARADLFSDALSGTPLAVQRRGPILLTPVDELAPGVAAELQRVLPTGATVTLLGGDEALEPAVELAVNQLGYPVDRVAGEDRFATAGAIADRLAGVTTLLLADGNDFPDALAAGAVANGADGAVLLTADATVPPATTAALQARPVATLYAIGGAASRAVPTALPVVGKTRVETAVEVADTFTPDPVVVGIASGFDFPDALAGGVFVARGGGPVVLSGGDQLVGPTQTWLSDHAATLQRVYLFGGPAALSPAVEDATRVAVGAG